MRRSVEFDAIHRGGERGWFESRFLSVLAPSWKARIQWMEETVSLGLPVFTESKETEEEPKHSPLLCFQAKRSFRRSEGIGLCGYRAAVGSFVGTGYKGM